jgi:hypothetical protein
MEARQREEDNGERKSKHTSCSENVYSLPEFGERKRQFRVERINAL